MGTNTPKLGLAGCSYVANTRVLSTSGPFPCPRCSSELRRPNHLAARPCVRGNGSRVIIGCARGLGMAIKAELMGFAHEINRVGAFPLALTQTARGEANPFFTMMITHPTLCKGSSKQRTATPYVGEQGPGPAQPQAGGVAALCSFTALRPQMVLTIASVPAVAQAASSKPPTSRSLTGLRAAQNSEQQ